MGLTDSEDVIIDWLYFAFGLFSFLCSLLTIFIVYYMKTWNGYLLIMVATTICQMCYDANFILAVDDSFLSCQAWHFLDIFGGLSVSIWTNVLSFIILFILINIKSVDIFKYFKFYFVLAVLLPLSLAIITVSTPGVLIKPCQYSEDFFPEVLHNLYYWGRALTIFINILVFVFIYRKLFRMSINSKEIKQFTNRSTDLAGCVEADAKAVAIYTLVSRLKYYPLMQVICRAGAAWNEFDDYNYQTFESAIAGSILSPSTGACYFVVFLMVQPKAYETFLRLFCCVKKTFFLDFASSFQGTAATYSSDRTASVKSADSAIPVQLWSEEKLENIIDRRSVGSESGLSDFIGISQELRVSRILSSSFYHSDEIQNPMASNQNP